MAFSSGGQGGLMAEINVTPFVDVMLVLLIIFMVTAPLMTTGVDLNLPRATAPPMDRQPGQLVLTIDKDGRYLLGTSREDQVEYPLSELKVKIPAVAKANPDTALVLEADGALPYEKVARVLAICNRAGIAKLGMATQLDPED